MRKRVSLGGKKGGGGGERGRKEGRARHSL